MEIVGREITKHQSVDSRRKLQRQEQKLTRQGWLKAEGKTKTAIKEPDHSRKLSFENNAIEKKSLLVITTGLYSVLRTKQPEPQKRGSHKYGTFATSITHYKGFLLKV